MRMLLFSVFCVCAVFVFGCQDSATTKNADAAIDGNRKFPKFLIGRWVSQSEESQWGIQLTSDGTVARIYHHFAGDIDLQEGGDYLEGPDEGTYAFFIAGDCTANFDSETNYLKVEINLDQYNMQLPQGNLQGKSKDIFEGYVSKTSKIWKTKWKSFTWLEGAAPPDVNEINANLDELVFKKIVTPQ